MRIALYAPRRSGKTTVAQHLVDRFGFTRIAMADPLKDSAVDMINYWLRHQGHPRQITREELDANKPAFRPLLEWLGTPFGRDYLGTPDRWIDSFREYLPDEGNVVVDDMRQPNEADALRDLGFVIIRVDRPEETRRADLEAAGEPVGPMPSERALDAIDPDYVLVNDSGLSTLYGRTATLMFEIACRSLGRSLVEAARRMVLSK